MLSTYVQDGLVDYEGLKRDGRPRLDAYLGGLETQAGRWDAWARHERLAFWVNAYNAYMIRLVLEHHPIAEVRSIGGVFGGATFRRRFIPLGSAGGSVSLDDIEHWRLRSEFNDARIHFAVVCASRSCPALRPDAYQPALLDAQLDEAARRFLADRSKNRYDPDTNTLWLSAIFDWFREDFERDAGTLPGFVMRHLPASDLAVVRARRPRIRFLKYDWTLNARAPRGSEGSVL